MGKGIPAGGKDMIEYIKVRKICNYPVREWLANFSGKGQIVYIVDFASHMFSVVTIQLCNCRVKATIGNTQTNDGGFFPIIPYL